MRYLRDDYASAPNTKTNSAFTGTASSGAVAAESTASANRPIELSLRMLRRKKEP